jgi:DNA-binding NarL/FixJ family response regulator
MPDKLRISIVEDDELIRESFVSIIDETPDLVCSSAYEKCELLLQNLNKDKPDLILMDISLPGMSGIEGIKKIKKLLPGVNIIVVTVHDNDKVVFDALCAGACGYLTKNLNPGQLIESIREAFRGGAPMSTGIARIIVNSFHKNMSSPLSPRETEVLQLLSKGKSYTMIADQLFIDKETVRSHIKNIYIKLEVNSKADAIEKATKDKLI